MNTKGRAYNRFVMTDDDIKIIKVYVAVADGQLLVIKMQKQRKNRERVSFGALWYHEKN